jgi:hypothetical protein
MIRAFDENKPESFGNGNSNSACAQALIRKADAEGSEKLGHLAFVVPANPVPAAQTGVFPVAASRKTIRIEAGFRGN